MWNQFEFEVSALRSLGWTGNFFQPISVCIPHLPLTVSGTGKLSLPATLVATQVQLPVCSELICSMTREAENSSIRRVVVPPPTARGLLFFSHLNVIGRSPSIIWQVMAARIPSRRRFVIDWIGRIFGGTEICRTNNTISTLNKLCPRTTKAVVSAFHQNNTFREKSFTVFFRNEHLKHDLLSE